MKNTKNDILEARSRLLEVVKQGDALYCILRHTSASGMSRVIDIKHISRAGVVSHLGHLAATALDMRYDRARRGIKVSGCGMDMGFHVVSNLNRVLYGDTYAIRHEWL